MDRVEAPILALFALILTTVGGDALSALNGADCGSTKGCFTRPNNCDPAVDCEAAVTFHHLRGGVVTFQMAVKRGSGTQYVALGFSEDAQMGNDAVVSCIMDGTTTGYLNLGKNPSGYSPHQTISLTQAQRDNVFTASRFGIVDGYLICQFTLKVQVDSSIDVWGQVSLDNEYHLLLANGAAEVSDTLHIHTGKSYSAGKVNVTSVGVVGAASMSFGLAHLHGILMILAWWCLTSPAILFAAYFKGHWKERKPFGLALWFHFHRTLNLLTVAATIVAAVLILWSRSFAWSGPTHLALWQWTPNQWHSLLGAVVLLLGWSQPVNALFRCHPGTPKRPIFNWVHRTTGTLAIVGAHATIFLATNFFPPMQQLWVKALIIVLWVIDLAFVVALEVTAHLDKKAKEGDKTNDMPLQSRGGKGANGPTTTQAALPPTTYFKVQPMLLAAFWAITVVFALILFVNMLL